MVPDTKGRKAVPRCGSEILLMRILTFDIEEWFHLLEHDETAHVDSWGNFESRVQYGVDLILQALDDHGARATFFCLGWIAETHPFYPPDS